MLSAGCWFGMAVYYFQNYPEEVRNVRFLPSEYLHICRGFTLARQGRSTEAVLSAREGRLRS